MAKPIIIKNNKTVNVYTEECSIDQAVVYESDDAVVSVPSSSSKRYSPRTGREWFKEWYYNDRTFTSLADEHGVNLRTIIHRCYKEGLHFMQERVEELESTNDALLGDNFHANTRIKELNAQVKEQNEIIEDLRNQLAEYEDVDNRKCDGGCDTSGC